MQRVPTVDSSHNYNRELPDATFDLTFINGKPAHRIAVWRACGAKGRLRIREDIQRPGDSEVPLEVIRHLYIGRDAVLPMYAVTMSRRADWKIGVCYDQGGEPVIYSFRDMDQALSFQSMVTDYEVASYIENTSIYITHRRHHIAFMNTLKVRPDPEWSVVGGVQLWRRRTPTAGPRPGLASQSPGVGPGSDSSARSEQRRRLSDSLSSFSDSRTGRKASVFEDVPKPVLVILLKEENGSHSMMKTELTSIVTSVRENILILQPKPQGANNTFTFLKITVSEADLASWDISALGALGNTSSRKKSTCNLICSSLVLDPRDGDAGSIEFDILKLQVEHGEDSLANDLYKQIAWVGRDPEAADEAAGLSRISSGFTGSSSSSGAASRLPILPVISSFEPLPEEFDPETRRRPA